MQEDTFIPLRKYTISVNNNHYRELKTADSYHLSAVFYFLAVNSGMPLLPKEGPYPHPRQ